MVYTQTDGERMKFGTVFCDVEEFRKVLFYTDRLPINLSHFLFFFCQVRIHRFGIELLDDLSIKATDMILGLLSGIPKCCALAFVMDQVDKERTPSWVQYYPCRKCISKGKYAHRPFPNYISCSPVHLDDDEQSEEV